MISKSAVRGEIWAKSTDCGSISSESKVKGMNALSQEGEKKCRNQERHLGKMLEQTPGRYGEARRVKRTKHVNLPNFAVL